MKKYLSRPMWSIIMSLLCMIIFIFFIVKAASFPTKHNEVWSAVISYSFLTSTLLYFCWGLFVSIEFVQFTKDGIIIKNIFHTIIINWNDIYAIKVDYLLAPVVSIRGMCFKWIEIKTDKEQINTTLISGINHKHRGPWYFLARDKIMIEFKKDLFLYRRDLLHCLK